MDGSIAVNQQTISHDDTNTSINRHYICKPGKHKRDLPKQKNIICKVRIKYVENICYALWDGEYFWAKMINIDPFWIVWWEEADEVNEETMLDPTLYSG